MNTFTNVVVNTLTDVNFIAGSYKELYFYLFTSACAAIDISTLSVSWVLYPYNRPEYIALSKSATCYDGYAVIPLLSTDTVNLAGKYMQRVTLFTGVSGYNYELGQGVVNITAAIGRT